MQYVLASKDAQRIMTLAHNQARKILAAAPHLTYRAALQQALKSVHALFKLYCALEQAFNEWRKKVLTARKNKNKGKMEIAARATCNYKQALCDGYYAVAQCDGYRAEFYLAKYMPRDIYEGRPTSEIRRTADSPLIVFNLYITRDAQLDAYAYACSFEHKYNEWLFDNR